MSEVSSLKQNPATSDAVARLERELSNRARTRWLRRLVVVLALSGAWFAVQAWRDSNRPPPVARFVESELESRSVVQLVESTGRLKPLTEVQVGAQVSGRVVRVLVDFNSQVKEGDLLAEIDPQLLGAQVGQVGSQLKAAAANLERAKSREETTRIELERLRTLAAEGIATQVELQQAQSAYDVARADVAAAQANRAGLRSQLVSARTTLEYTKIHSPIDGVVINRTVEPGQTVAASFAAPVLFVIAQDLSKMQVLADIDEADVGKLEQGMAAQVTVDAFLGQRFEGTVTQIRYSPNELQGVVTYSAVIDVDNPELKLRPGMTATVAVTTRKADNVVAVRNSALRFKPEDKGLDMTPLEFGQARVYQVTGGQVGSEEITAKVIRVGITDGLWSEVIEGAASGEKVVTEQTDKETKERKFMGLF